MDYWTHHISILATELKPAGCAWRLRNVQTASGIDNENITRMSLSFNPDPVYFGELLTPPAMTERHGEDSIYR